uniref:Uncharacterized protein n=1 Tax=Arundo donax TaxID=35708 RepID=A0A0A9BTI3_ARUDO
MGWRLSFLVCLFRDPSVQLVLHAYYNLFISNSHMMFLGLDCKCRSRYS